MDNFLKRPVLELQRLFDRQKTPLSCCLHLNFFALLSSFIKREKDTQTFYVATIKVFKILEQPVPLGELDVYLYVVPMPDEGYGTE